MNAIASADLWFVDDEIGWPNGSHHSDQWSPPTYDPLRYIVWIYPGRRGELAPRTALHVRVVVDDLPPGPGPTLVVRIEGRYP